MLLLSSVLQRLSAEQFVGHYINYLMAGPVKISFLTASTVPVAIIQAMNQYFGDKGNEQARLTWSGDVQGIDVYTFENGVGVDGALAETDDLAKASNVFRNLGLMKGKPTVQKPQKPKKEEQVPEPRPEHYFRAKYPILVVPGGGTAEQAERMLNGLRTLISDQRLSLKVSMQPDQDEWWYTFRGNVTADEFDRLRAEIEQQLSDLDIRWEGQKKLGNEGDYAYEKSRLDIF